MMNWIRDYELAVDDDLAVDCPELDADTALTRILELEDMRS